MDYRNQEEWEACRLRRAQTRAVLMDLLLEHEGFLKQLCELVGDASKNLDLDTCEACKKAVPAGSLVPFKLKPVHSFLKTRQWGCPWCTGDEKAQEQLEKYIPFQQPLTLAERDNEVEVDELFEEISKSAITLLQCLGGWEDMVEGNNLPEETK